MDRPATAELPDQPGVYLFRDEDDRVIYVGKAKSIRKRLSQYFNGDLPYRSGLMLAAATGVEWILTANEVESLMLENTLIKQHQPRFNVRLRDDKSFPYLAITRSDQWPRARVVRGKKRKGFQYFGPYVHAYAIRKTLNQLLRTFPIRTCSDGLFKRQAAQGRPCLLFHLEKCCGPCVEPVDPDEYQQWVDGLAAFLQGQTEPVVSELEQKMRLSAEKLEFEQAARFRDRLEDIERVLERQEVVSDTPANFDLFAGYGDELETAIQTLIVRQGMVVGRWGTVVDKVEEMNPGEVIGAVLRSRYSDETPPPTVLVIALPPEPETWMEWLASRREGPVRLLVPQRGSKRRLLETTVENARQYFTRHRLQRQTDHNSRARALRSLAEVLQLPIAPLRIEAYDVSTLAGTDTVASMVVMEDGLPKPSEYRRFKIRGVDGQDDFASMEEALSRRFDAYLLQRDRPSSERSRFAYPPSLVLIDGGVGQLGRAVKVLAERQLDIPVIGLAKRMEEVYQPGDTEPIRIPRDAEALYLLQAVRDEAHRFAVEYHRNLRSKRMVGSALDGIPGLGPVRKRTLLHRFGSIRKIKAAELDELATVIPVKVAENLHSALHG